MPKTARAIARSRYWSQQQGCTVRLAGAIPHRRLRGEQLHGAGRSQRLYTLRPMTSPPQPRCVVLGFSISIAPTSRIWAFSQVGLRNSVESRIRVKASGRGACLDLLWKVGAAYRCLYTFPKLC